MTTRKNTIPVIGILGGMGSGKSTVARLFGKLGCQVIDADAIAHEILNTSEVEDILGREFGTGIFAADGTVSRKALADVVFSNPDKLARLNSIIHPRALERTEQVIATVRREGLARGIVVDAPLLVEAGWHEKCDVLVFVDSNTENRLARIKQRAGLSREQFEAREKSQISLDRKARLAYYTLDNNSDLSALEGQVGAVFSMISG
jgi:dephospho-CoA kinase